VEALQKDVFQANAAKVAEFEADKPRLKALLHALNQNRVELKKEVARLQAIVTKGQGLAPSGQPGQMPGRINTPPPGPAPHLSIPPQVNNQARSPTQARVWIVCEFPIPVWCTPDLQITGTCQVLSMGTRRFENAVTEGVLGVRVLGKEACTPFIVLRGRGTKVSLPNNVEETGGGGVFRTVRSGVLCSRSTNEYDGMATS